MVNEKILFVGVLVIILLGVIPLVIAVDDLISLQGNVKQSGANLASGNITVTIYDAFTGGNMIYNSTTDFNSAISSGEYDVVLGNSSNTLSLNYGQYYYMELYVNNEKITYQNGGTRQIFQSSVGNISVEDIDFSSKIVLTNSSSTFDAGQNLTMGAGGWFKGIFDWFIGSDSTQYLTFNGTTLSISSLANNTWTSTYNSTYAQWAYNQSLSNTITQWLYNQTLLGDNLYINMNSSSYFLNESQLNKTIDTKLNSSDMNLSVYNINVTYINVTEIKGSKLYFTFINATYMNVSQLFVGGEEINGSFIYNHTLHTFNTYNSTWDNRALIFSINTSANIQTLENQSIFNATYNIWTYNQTLGGDQRFVNIDGDTMTNTLTVSSGGINITGDSIFGGGWQQGGTTISGGNIFTQVLYVVNITSLGVSNLNVNGSIIPDTNFNDTFDLGSSSLQWNDLYLGTGDLYLGGTGQKKWWYNQTQSIYYYNQTATHFFYNMTDTRFYYNQTLLHDNLYLNFNASSYFIRENILNLTIARYTSNLSINNTIYNQTYQGLISNTSYLSTFNATYDIWSYNQSLSNTITQWLYNQTIASGWNLSGTNLFTGRTNYLVGIGTTTPSHLLTISGNFSAGDSYVGNISSPTLYDTTSQGLLFAMNFNNESIINNIPLDSSGYGHHGTLVGTTIYNSTGGFNSGGAYEFRENGLINFGVLNNDQNLSRSDFSVSLWARWNELIGGTKRVISYRGNDGWEIRSSAVGQIDIVIFFAGTGQVASFASGLNNNTWYHVVATLDRQGNQVIYINGEVKDTDDISAQDGNSIESNNPFCIGSGLTCVTGTHNGTIDDVRIYNRALTPQEVKALYLQRDEVVDGYVSQRNVFVDSIGRVGIGTSSPTSTLEINGNFTIKGLTSGNFSINQNTFYVNGSNVGIGTSNPSHLLTISNSATALNVSGMLYVNSSNVGIGTASPTSALDVTGKITTNSGLVVSGGGINLTGATNDIQLGITGHLILDSFIAGAKGDTTLGYEATLGDGQPGFNFKVDSTEELQISSTQIRVPYLAGTGNDYVCVDADGDLFRSNTAC